MATTNVILDVWSALSHKSNIGDTGQEQGLAPSWTGATNRRRLNAYLLLWAYRRNGARYWLDQSNPDRVRQHREYGDAELMVQTIRAAVLGEDVTIQVESADGEVPPEPTEDDVASLNTDSTDDENDPTPVDGAQTLAELRAEWADLSAEIERAVARQEWFDEWAIAEKWALKLVENENNTCGLGDSVYLFAWSNRKSRVRVRTYEPGFYFPVWDDDSDDEEFPSRVHLAWEIEDDDDVKWIRRITFELVTIAEAMSRGVQVEGTRFAARASEAEGALVQPGDVIVKDYPYAEEGDEPSDLVCLMSDGKWKLDGIGARKWDDLDEGKAEWRTNEDGELIRDLDLGLDFVPVLHVPNTPTFQEHWGESVLLRVAQIFDDLAANDTDLAIAAALSASPPIAIAGTAAAGGTITSYGPGQVFWTGDGSMTMLDTSKALDALLKFAEYLLDRLSVNRQVPGSVMGRVDQATIKSGLHLLLTFGPFRQYVTDLRMVRDDKYQLGFKMVQRIAMANGDERVTDVQTTKLGFGSFMPSDLDQLRQIVVALVGAHLLSKATGLRWLQEAGAPIDSIDDELAAIEREDFAGASELADATNMDEMAIEYLGRTAEAERIKATKPAPTAPIVDPNAPPQPPEPPEPNVPPVPLS